MLCPAAQIRSMLPEDMSKASMSTYIWWASSSFCAFPTFTASRATVASHLVRTWQLLLLNIYNIHGKHICCPCTLQYWTKIRSIEKPRYKRTDVGIPHSRLGRTIEVYPTMYSEIGKSSVTNKMHKTSLTLQPSAVFTIGCWRSCILLPYTDPMTYTRSPHSRSVHASMMPARRALMVATLSIIKLFSPLILLQNHFGTTVLTDLAYGACIRQYLAYMDKEFSSRPIRA